MLSKLLIFFILIGVAVAAPRQSTLWQTEQSDASRRCYTPRHLDEDSLHQYDLLKISAQLSFNLESPSLEGQAAIELVANEIPLDVIDLRLTYSLTLNAIWSETHEITSYDFLLTDSIRIHLASPVAVGDTAVFHIAYMGLPDVIDTWGGMHFHPQSAWRPAIAYALGDGLNLSPPTATYTWLPCHLDPVDKVLFEAWFTVNDTLEVASNGTRVDTLNNGDGTTTWHYRLDQPVSTYLLFVSVSDYELMVQRESGPLIENFVYPSRVTQAQTHFEHVPQVLDGFVQLFGEYPFDRFGYNMTRNGDMEHATCVSHVDGAVIANHSYDWLLFHELSHQWWGDWVTIGDWRDMWLNEGFATYCQALGVEIMEGHEAYTGYVVNELMPPARATPNYTIYDPDYYWGTVVYEKGACVLHMLRFVMGDTSFFEALRDYGQTYAYATAITADFQAVCEEHYGETLDWFFDQWVYEGTRYPRYEIMVYPDTRDFIVTQVQDGPTLFRMPFEILWHLDSGDTLITYWNDAVESQIFPVPTDTAWEFFEYEFDPDSKILCTAQESIWVTADEQGTSIPEQFQISSVYPNPFNPSATIEFALDSPSDVQLRVADVLGRAVSDVNLGRYNAGYHSTVWDGSRFASGIYLFTLSTPKFSRTTKAVLLK